MAKPSTTSARIGEPPPLPPSDGHGRVVPLTVAIVVGIALVILLVLLAMMKESPNSSANSGGNGKGTSGSGNQSGEVGRGFDGDTGAAEANSNNGRNPTPSTADAARIGSQHDATNDSDSGDIANLREHAGVELNPDATEDHTIDVQHAPSDEKDANEQASGSQFFTLNGRKPRIVLPDSGDRLSSDAAAADDAFSGRSGRGKEELLQAEGGTAATEAAVKLGLEWLAQNQQANGLWSWPAVENLIQML